MNIALFPSAFHPSLGGVEELTRQLAHALREKNHHVIILTNRWPRDLPEKESFEGLPLYRLPFRAPIGSLKAVATYAATTHSIRSQLLTILREHSVDLLHVQCVSGNALYATHTARTLQVPLIVSLQGELTMDAAQIYQRSNFARRLYKNTLAAADALTACSGHTLAEAESFFGQPFGLRGSVIPNGIRLADFANIIPHQHPHPYFLAIGRHVPQKGFDILLYAFARAISQNPNLPHDLLLAGDGPAHADLQNLASSLNLANRVHFLGRTDRAQTASLFAGCDFFVLPSRHEPQGIVNLEAMAAGKPVIATRVGGVPEIVQHNHNGLLVPPENPEPLAAALLLLATNTALRNTLANNALACARDFDWPTIANRYVTIYQETAARRPAKQSRNPVTQSPRISIRGAENISHAKAISPSPN